MDKEAIIKKIDALEAQRKQLMLAFNAQLGELTGQIAALEWVLEQLEQAKSSKPLEDERGV